ncbi:MAG: ATP-binding protein [Salegentibacter sp.]
MQEKEPTETNEIEQRELRIRELEKELRREQEKLNLIKGRTESPLNPEPVSKISNKELNEELHRLKELIYSSPSLITLLEGEELIIKVANDPMLEFWGKGREIIGQPLVKAHPEIGEQGLKDLLLKVLRTGESQYGYEMPVYLMRDNEKVLAHFNFVYQPQYNLKGEVSGVAVIATEVTKEAKLHKELQAREKRFREMIDFMPLKISITDPEGFPYYYNKSWLDYTAWDREEIKTKHWTEVTHPEEQQQIKEGIHHSLSTGEDFEMEMRLQDKNGGYKWHLCRGIAVKDGEEDINFWVSSSTEIDEIKEEEKKKEDFLKLVSHELKTPVTSVKGYVQLLQSMIARSEEGDDIPLPVKPYLHRIEDQVNRLIRLISEMLDLSRIEQNELELQKSNFDICELIHQVIEDIRYTNKEVELNFQQDGSCTIFADKDRIGQVLINFITNAIKYSPESNEVLINLYTSGDSVSVSIKDKGIGIPEKDLKNIFKRFYRVEGKNENTYSGFGIGLYLSHQIIERHNGSIRVESIPGEGSEFIFTLPKN